MYAKSRIRQEKRITMMNRRLLHDMLTMTKLRCRNDTIIVIIQFKCKFDEFNKVLNDYKSITITSSDAPLHEMVHRITLSHCFIAHNF